MCQKIAQEQSDRGDLGDRRLWRSRRAPVEILAAGREIYLRGTVLVNKDGVTQERRPSRDLIYEAMVLAGLDWLDTAPPRHNLLHELDDATDDSDFSPVILEYRWARNPRYCHREEELSVRLSAKALAMTAQRAERAHILPRVLVLGAMVAGMSQSAFWLPRRGPLAGLAIRHWLESMRDSLPTSGTEEGDEDGDF